MTLKKYFLNKRALRAALPLAGLGVAAAAFTGCGGATQNGANLSPIHDSGPVIYGVNANANRQIESQETSGLSFTAGGTTSGAVIGVTSYVTTHGPGPLFTYQSAYPNGTPVDGVTSSPGVPLGFAAGAAYFNVAAAITVAAIPTNYAGSLTFGAYASSGVVNNLSVDIVPASIVLTSSESTTFSQPLTFIGAGAIGSGVLAQTQYQSAPFAIPAFMQTTGLHDLRTTIADVDGNSSTTDFAVATVAPTDVALFLQSFDTGTMSGGNEVFTAITAGDTVTIDGGKGIGVYPTGYAPTTADANGTVVLFTTPGTHTVTEADPTGKTVNTSTFTIPTTAAGTTLFAVPTMTATTVAAVARPHAVARAVKH
jgi:hypothetical protein